MLSPCYPDMCYACARDKGVWVCVQELPKSSSESGQIRKCHTFNAAKSSCCEKCSAPSHRDAKQKDFEIWCCGKCDGLTAMGPTARNCQKCRMQKEDWRGTGCNMIQDDWRSSCTRCGKLRLDAETELKEKREKEMREIGMKQMAAAARARKAGINRVRWDVQEASPVQSVSDEAAKVQTSVGLPNSIPTQLPTRTTKPAQIVNHIRLKQVNNASKTRKATKSARTPSSVPAQTETVAKASKVAWTLKVKQTSKATGSSETSRTLETKNTPNVKSATRIARTSKRTTARRPTRTEQKRVAPKRDEASKVAEPPKASGTAKTITISAKTRASKATAPKHSPASVKPFVE